VLALPDPRTTAAVNRRSALPLIAGVICVLAIGAVVVTYATQGDLPVRNAPAALPRPIPPPDPAPHVAPPAPVPADPPAPVPAAVPPQTPPVPDPPASSDPQGPRKRPVHKIVRGVGPITPAGPRTLPERTVEVHRGNHADPPRRGDHTSSGAPLEDTVDLDTKPTHGAGAPRATPHSPKDPSSP
jgi:hypothetical protein